MYSGLLYRESYTAPRGLNGKFTKNRSLKSGTECVNKHFELYLNNSGFIDINELFSCLM